MESDRLKVYAYGDIESLSIVRFESKIGDLAGETVGCASVHLVAGVRELRAELEVRERHSAVHPPECECAGQKACQMLLGKKQSVLFINNQQYSIVH